MRTNYVLIDFENVQPENLDVFSADHFKVIVFVGASQTKVPFDVAMALLLKSGNYPAVWALESLWPADVKKSLLTLCFIAITLNKGMNAHAFLKLNLVSIRTHQFSFYQVVTIQTHLKH